MTAKNTATYYLGKNAILDGHLEPTPLQMMHWWLFGYSYRGNLDGRRLFVGTRAKWNGELFIVMGYPEHYLRQFCQLVRNLLS